MLSLPRSPPLKPTPPPRLHLLQAPRAHVGVVFRRGPSKRTEIVRWDMRSDTIERGHWFTGRFYERRSDLSPHGELPVYFASKFNADTIEDEEYTYAWTAVSKPPWLTALALWPKGDCWWGGGMFTGRGSLRLNVATVASGALGEYRTIVDLTPDRPVDRIPPQSATRW